MNVSSRTASTWPRSTRTKPGTKTMLMAIEIVVRLWPSSAATARASSSGGKVNSASMTRMITLSSQPPT